MFTATAKAANDPVGRNVVVKFTPEYCPECHRLLASAQPRQLAPTLWFCERVRDVGGLWVVVMDFVEETRWWKSSEHKARAMKDLEAAIGLLHEHDLVFGDVREPNILRTGDGAMLIDFDWCGKEGEARYPSSIRIDGSIRWHEGVEYRGRMMKEHDIHMLEMFSREP